VLIQIYYCFYNREQYIEAIGWGQHILSEMGLNTTEQNHLRVSLSSAFTNISNYENARIYLSRIADSTDGELQDKMLLLESKIFAKEGDWYKSKDILLNIPAESKYVDIASKWASVADEGINLSYKSPTLAGILSIIPGLGYLYDGYYETALMSFAVNGVLIWATYEAYDEGLNGLGTALAMFTFGWYGGNIYGSIVCAEKENRKMQDDLLLRLNVGISF